ncbi:M24 family metallopeptidase [Microbacterium arborescens]|nr:M24 family metallopeptidase [Microbacterium arborescens]WJM16227.1 M24 family metallopeptidase [Microbacterium arborescens]
MSATTAARAVPPVSTAEREVKRRRLVAVREDAGAAALVLTSHEALSWYLGGARTHVSLAGPPVLAVRVAEDGDTLFVSANEADRLIAEELDAAGAARVVRVPWYESVVARAGAGDGGDRVVGEAEVGVQLRAARAELVPEEVDRYRALGRDVAETLTDVAAGLSPATSERTAASALAAELVERGIDPLVLLVAGHARLPHRHPLPTEAALGDRAMLVVCGRRHGLIANATRWVGAAGADDDRILAVEAAFFSATRPGTRLDEAFRAGCRGYAQAGFAPDEWERHHQGGPTGYAGRDPRATAETRDIVRSPHAFAWNPSAPGAKVEDTVLVSDAGVEVLTVDPRWPTTTVGGLARPVARPFG